MIDEDHRGREAEILYGWACAAVLLALDRGPHTREQLVGLLHRIGDVDVEYAIISGVHVPARRILTLANIAGRHRERGREREGERERERESIIEWSRYMSMQPP